MNMDVKDGCVLLIESNFRVALAVARDEPFAVKCVANPEQAQSSDALKRLLLLLDCRTADARCSGTCRPQGAGSMTAG